MLYPINTQSPLARWSSKSPMTNESGKTAETGAPVRAAVEHYVQYRRKDRNSDRVLSFSQDSLKGEPVLRISMTVENNESANTVVMGLSEGETWRLMNYLDALYPKVG